MPPSKGPSLDCRRYLVIQVLMSLRQPGGPGADWFGLTLLIDIIRCHQHSNGRLDQVLNLWNSLVDFSGGRGSIVNMDKQTGLVAKI